MISYFFFFCILMVFYTYTIYPLLLMLLGAVYRRNEGNGGDSDGYSITLVISAFNEEKIIGQKIKNALALNYNPSKFEIIVVSDCSTDRTDEVVKSFGNPRITLLRLPVRQGKTTGLNHAVRIAKGDIVIFTDADSMFDKDNLKRIAFDFNDPQVGLVTGSTRYVNCQGGRMVETSSLYTRLERLIKKLESRVGSCVGADGAIFAIRRSLYRTLEKEDINDFVIPLDIIKQGYRVIFDDELSCAEEASKTSQLEFKRQVRITNRTLKAIFRHYLASGFFKSALYSFSLISHKLVRFCVPLFLLCALGLNLILIADGYIYKLILLAQFIFYTLGIKGFFNERRNNSSKVNVIYFFLLINTAYLIGWLKFLSRKIDVVWDPMRN